MKSALTNVSLNDGAVWNGSFITASKIANGSVSNADFQRLNGLTSSILQDSDKGAASGLCPLNSNSIIPTQYLPSSVNEIIEVANFSALSTAGESSIYMSL